MFSSYPLRIASFGEGTHLNIREAKTIVLFIYFLLLFIYFVIMFLEMIAKSRRFIYTHLIAGE